MGRAGRVVGRVAPSRRSGPFPEATAVSHRMERSLEVSRASSRGDKRCRMALVAPGWQGLGVPLRDTRQPGWKGEDGCLLPFLTGAQERMGGCLHALPAGTAGVRNGLRSAACQPRVISTAKDNPQAR